MLRIAPSLVAVLLATAAFAADVAPGRYLVATKKPFGPGTLQALRDSVDQVVQPDGVRGFRSFRGFAADLTAEEVEALRASEEVRWVEPVVVRRTFDATPNILGQTVPLGVIDTGARAAAAGRRAGIVNVAVLDTGIDYTHAELKAIYAGGFNTFDDSDNAYDDHHHGTHVAGTIAAADNGLGVVGVAPGVRLWGVKVLNSDGQGYSDQILTGLDWVLDQKKKLGGNWIVNMSIGSEDHSSAEREAFQRAADAGVLLFAATGNMSTEKEPQPVAFPAGYPSVNAVVAVDAQRKLGFFSNRGPEVDFAAPGVKVLSTVPVGSKYLSYIYDGQTAQLVRYVNGSAKGTFAGEYVYCGLGAPGDFPASVEGKIALLRRGGGITFADKTLAAMNAGAKAVAIFNSDDSVNPWTLQTDFPVDWPVVLRLTLEVGEALAAKGSGPLTVSYDLWDYDENSGTSMACPHAAGAAAVLWMLAPEAPAEAILNAMRATAIDLGAPGQDGDFGHGMVNVYAAARQLAPNAFPTAPTTGRAPGRRGR
ncbi:MAG TPA: S8 family serine peptidase [Thermoanaerobaculia bacterium]|jgi:subtilisin family serine protease